MGATDYENLIRTAFSIEKASRIDVQGDPAGLARAGFWYERGEMPPDCKAAAMYAMAVIRKQYDNGVDPNRWNLASKLISEMNVENSAQECDAILVKFVNQFL